MPEPDEFPIPFPVPWGKDLQGLSEPLRNGPMMISRVNDAATKAGQAIAARQVQHLTESMSDVRVLLSDATSTTSDPTAVARACAAYMQAGMQRNLALLGFLTQTMAMLTQQMLSVPPIVQAPVPADEDPQPQPPHGQMSKANGRAVTAKT